MLAGQRQVGLADASAVGGEGSGRLADLVRHRRRHVGPEHRLALARARSLNPHGPELAAVARAPLSRCKGLGLGSGRGDRDVPETATRVGHDTELERRLQAERPQAPDELVRRLSAQIEPARPARRSTTPRVALICAVTAAIALSLGVAGAIGSATGSIHAFSRGVIHLVQPSVTPPPSLPTAVTPDHNQGGQSPSDPRFSSHWHFGWGPPFGQQYAEMIPICWHGQIIYVTPFEYLWYFIHGASPARDCFLRHR